MAVSFTRGFQHTDWVDNVDRVQAGGDGGFNKRFHDIEADFESVRDVVDAISRALDSLSAAPPAQQAVASIAPTFVQIGAVGWAHGTGFATKAGGQTSGSGMVNVPLPNGARLDRLRVLGIVTGAGDLTIELRRQALADTARAVILAEVDGTTNPFDRGATVTDPALRTVDTTSFKYFITASLNGAAVGDQVFITALQVYYAS